jgi:hypothetical protein
MFPSKRRRLWQECFRSVGNPTGIMVKEEGMINKDPYGKVRMSQGYG